MDESCDYCRQKIRPEEFERGEAVRLLGKVFCPRCMAAAIERSKRPDAPPSLDFLTPRPRPPL